MDILHRIKSCLPLNTRITVFNSYVLPFDYTLCYKNMRLENVQNFRTFQENTETGKAKNFCFGSAGRVKGSADRRIWPKISFGLRISTIISADLWIQ